MTEGEKVKLQAWVEQYTDDMLERASLRLWELRTGTISTIILDERIRRVLMAKGRDAAKLPDPPDGRSAAPLGAARR